MDRISPSVGRFHCTDTGASRPPKPSNVRIGSKCSRRRLPYHARLSRPAHERSPLPCWACRTPAVVPFTDPDPSRSSRFRRVVAAKRAVADELAMPLAKLTPAELEALNALLTQTLRKTDILTVCPDPSETRLSRMMCMLSEVMAYYGFTRDVRYVGYFETVQHQHIIVALKTAIKQGQLVALSGIVGCGKTTTLHRLQEVLGHESDMVVSKSLAVDKDRVHLGTLIMALFYDLAPEKDVTIPTQPEKRERQLLELIHKRRKTVALFIDEAHDLHSRTLFGLKRLMELVRASGETLSVVLAGHPRLTNDLRRPALEEIGSRATVFMLDGVKGQQRAYITWLLEHCTLAQTREDILTDPAFTSRGPVDSPRSRLSITSPARWRKGIRWGKNPSRRTSSRVCWRVIWMTWSHA